MTIEALLTGTVIKEAAPNVKTNGAPRYEFTVTLLDFMGKRSFAVCSSNHAATVEESKTLRRGDVVAIRGHIAIVPGSEKGSGNNKGTGSYLISITGLMSLAQPNKAGYENEQMAD